MAAKQPVEWLGQMEALLKACADQTRLRLLNLLAAEGEVAVGHLVAVLRTNQPKVSRHLAYLKRAGLVADRKDGLLVYYRLAAGLPAYAERLLACLRACSAEVAPLQREVAQLQKIRVAQAPKPAAAPMTVVAVMETAQATATDQEERSELQIELL